MSLAASASGASAGMPIVDLALPAGDNLSGSMMLGDEEISGVTLATFHLFDQDAVKSMATDNVQLARGCGCGRGCGGRGCGGRGCGGRGWGGGCRGCGGGWRGCGWGGCWSGCGGGCCLSWGGCYLC
ncbi:MAG: hypothetical protein WAK01_08440 [Methylocystis sp.]